ncbi:DHA2 family efflux MFS transporter permease subunit [Burkholderia multivorans]|uniref:DHA2 family efflux MFS transporter permease subunit n=1 Tax=Burkholderia multivorans TaxID=87883 RepID=UPI00158E2A1D|nr:DHA2 family efflux MFS transporter permease subunit [Burkholderia multivorans]MDR8876561.1 Multidrug export protein EmrB [Burkholderia multivorans]MDR8882410.1 Multidrug export protein EmrB [Burkholderia multivorans]MDR8888770.1 Multidrug export protein EmrB [Burkholderia multivorans]MDR8895971.1 Multidrug export protein EmrB [Burkholderia multivorans]MDR8901998.1 Multidrug export protein EmrB [Burkholderia multivorans]
MTSGTSQQDVSGPNRALVTVSVMLATIMQVLDSTIANVALPHMQGSLSATQDQITWVLTSYIVAAAIATPLTGWIASRVGRKQLFLWAVAGFTAASIACGMSTSLGQMVGARLLQGLFGASLVPLSQAVMLDINPPEKHGQAMAVWGAGVTVGPILGPTLGGWLTDSYNWRWVFYVNVPVGIIAFFGIWLFMSETRVSARKLDLFGFASLGIAIGALQLFLDRGEVQDWFDSIEIWVESLTALIAFAFFLVHTLTVQTTSFFNRELAKDRNFVVGCGFYFVMGAVLYATRALLPPMLQNLMQYSVVKTGLVTAPSGAGTMITMMLAGRLVGPVSPRTLIAAGFGIAAFSLWQMSGYNMYMSESTIIWSGFLQGMGLGLISVSLTTATFSTLGQELRGDGTAIYSLSRNIGSSIGISFVQTELTRNTQVAHSSLAEYVSRFNPLAQPDVLPFVWNINDPSGLAALNQEVTRQAAMIAYVDDFRLLLCLTVGVMPFLVLLGKRAYVRSKRKHLATTVIDDGEKRHQSGAHHFRFDGHHCDRAGSQAGEPQGAPKL